MKPINLKDANDLELMKFLGANDLEAWSELVSRYSNLVYAIAFQILKNVNDTEDAVQNTFFNLKVYANKFDNTQELKPWLARIASVESIRIYNKKKYINKKESVRMATNTSHQSQRREASEIVEQKEIEVLVKKAIDLLPEPTRVAITLYYAGGMNQTDIANELDLSQDAISRKIKAGLENIKTYLKKAGIHASIVLSPNLVQESLSHTKPSQAFIQKLTKQLPTQDDIVKASSESLRGNIASSSQINASTWIGGILGTMALTILGYFYFTSKNNVLPQSTLPAKTEQSNKVIDLFKPVNFINYEPLFFAFGKKLKDINNPNEYEEGLMEHIGGEPKWLIQKNEGGDILKHQDNTENNGCYFNQTFTQAYVFKGTFVLNNEKTWFGFLIKSPYNEQKTVYTQIKNEEKRIEKAINDQSICSGVVQPGFKGEVDFKIFIWPNQGKWNSICNFSPKNDSTRSFFRPATLSFVKHQFNIGIFSNGNSELIKFEYCPLDSKWEPRLDPDIKGKLDLKDLKNDFFNHSWE